MYCTSDSRGQSKPLENTACARSRKWEAAARQFRPTKEDLLDHDKRMEQVILATSHLVVCLVTSPAAPVQTPAQAYASNYARN